jgi:hypothetical protein
MIAAPWFRRKLTSISFGPATQGASPESDEYLSWWNVPIGLRSRSGEVSDCRVWLRIMPEGTERQLAWAGHGGPSLERTLRFGDEPQIVPVVARAEKDCAITAGLPTLPHFPLPARVARITDVQAIYHRQNFVDLPPGEHRLCLVVRHGESEFPGPIYRLQVPNPSVGNGHFVLTRTEDF